MLPPHGQAWRVGRERALVLGGPAALLLQVAHPAVAAGVVEHSDFESDPLGRLHATLDAVLTVAFGDLAQARRAAARVGAVHRPVRGPGYDARDPELALWVHATLVMTALEVFDRFVRPLTEPERAAYYEEYAAVGYLFGVTEAVMPASYEAFQAYVEEVVSDVLVVGKPARAIARAVFDAKVLGPRLLTRPAMELAAASLLPARVRHAYGLRWGPGHRAAHAAVRGGTRLVLGVVPRRARYWQHYHQACRRWAAGADGATRVPVPAAGGGDGADELPGPRPSEVLRARTPGSSGTNADRRQ